MENISFAYACKHNLTNIVKKYLEYKNDKRHEKWVARMKKSDLMFTAIQRGQIELVKIFINQGFGYQKTKTSSLLNVILFVPEEGGRLEQLLMRFEKKAKLQNVAVRRRNWILQPSKTSFFL